MKCKNCQNKRLVVQTTKLQYDVKYPKDKTYMFMNRTVTCLECKHVDKSKTFPNLLISVFSI